MADARAVTRLLDELLWTLRREGFVISTAQAIDAARAVRAVGLGDREVMREALAAVVVGRARERPRFDATFAAFFDAARTEGRGARLPLLERLARRGFSEPELAELRALLEALASAGDVGDAAGADGGLATLLALLEGGAELDRRLQLGAVTRTLASMQSALQLGFFAHRVLDEVGVPRARSALGFLRARLADAFGVRGEALADALAAELDDAAEEARRHVRAVLARRSSGSDTARPRGEGSRAVGPRRTTDVAFTSLTDAEIGEVRRAVRAFAERLRGGERVRARRARKGRIDPHKMLRRALATGGVPFSPCRRRRRRDRPRLLVLCDVSDSVRAAATFMLEVVAVAHELFERTRSFVFVSELGETTRLFAESSVDRALAHAYGGGVVPVTHNSNYGRVLRAFEARHLHELDRRTTVVVLGDGRTNYHDAAADVLRRIRERARALVWLCPEPRAAWASGDSAMSRYETECTHVLEVKTARDLEDATRLLVALR